MKKIGLYFLFLLLSTRFVFGAGDDIRLLLHRFKDNKKYEGHHWVVVFDSTRTFVEESGLSKVFMHQLFKVLDVQGCLSKRVITLGYDPLSAYVKILEVNIFKANGDIIRLDTSLVKDYPAPARAIYWGAREKMLEVGRLEPGDALEVKLFRKGFTYALLTDEPGDEKYIPPMRGHFYDIVPFWSAEPVVEKVYQVNLPAIKNLQFEFYNGEARVSSVLRGERKIYTFTKTDIFPLKSEPSMVAWSDVAPKLLLSTSPDWKAKSLWFFGVNEKYGSFETTPEITSKTQEILQGARDELDSISKLTHWVADEIRYSGLSMGEGEGYTLHKGEMTFRDRCGVCKDKAGMLITMLRAAGFKSYAAMTMAGERIDYIPADQFNHSVTVVQRRDGSYMLLDPTWVPFTRELWSSLEQQQGVLMGLPEGADLMYTPISAPENHPVFIKGQSRLLPDGTLEGSFTITGEGQSESAIRSVFSGSASTEWDKNLERELLRIHPAAVILEKSYTNPDDYLGQPISITIKYRIPGYAVAGNKGILFTPLLFNGLFMRAQPQLGMSIGISERKYAFRDRCSRWVEIEETIELPEGWQPQQLQQNVHLLGDAASFDGDASLKGNQLSIKHKAIYNKRIYEPGEWPNFRDVLKAQRWYMDNPLLLVKQ
ncbi:MAG: hypothetical protein PWR20_2001 [Bacteroidales bacterium]|nr:hypothetical protein [Bacteroidales bacterium]MDN5329625.1 hypothetical protein [Bacteroidales bacterium]